MPISQKPFAALNVAQLQAKISELTDVVGDTAKGSEKVNMAELQSAVQAKNDPVLTSTFERVSKEYGRSFGLDGTVPVLDRKPLREKGVKSVMQLLIDSRSAVKDLDNDGDGLLDRTEVLQKRHDPFATSGERIASSAASTSRQDFENGMQALLSTPQNKNEATARADAYRHLRHLSQMCSQSPEGENALMAHLQNFLFDSPNTSASGAHGKMLKTLRNAEDSFFKRTFGAPDLSDGEVSKLVGSGDLKAYADDTKARFKAQNGASFEELWLDGQDAKSVDVLNPHFHPAD